MTRTTLILLFGKWALLLSVLEATSKLLHSDIKDINDLFTSNSSTSVKFLPPNPEVELTLCRMCLVSMRVSMPCSAGTLSSRSH